MRHSSRRNSTYLALGAVLLLVCAAAVASLIRQRAASDFWVRHTVDVQAQLADARIQALRSEIALRGYLLTGDPVDLSRYRTAHDLTERRIVTLRRITADNRAQTRNIDALRGIEARHDTLAGDELRLATTGRDDAAAAIVGSPANRTTADARRAALDRIGAEEARLLKARSERSRQLELAARATLAAALGLVVLLAGIAFADRRQQLKALGAAYDELERDSAIRAEVEEQLRLLAANATDAVFRLGLDARFTYASPSTRQVFGVDPALVPGHHLTFGVHPDDRATLSEAMAAMAAGETDRAIVTYRTARPEGEDWRWVESSVGLVRDADGAPSEIIAAVRDVSKRKALELELEAARESAEAAVRAKAAFLANMSHEIRTPMNGVLGFADLLLAGELAPEQRRHVELIADSGRAMMRLLNDILDLSKVDAGQMQIASEAFDLRHALKGCARLVMPAIEQKGLTLVTRIADDVPTTVCGDGLRVRQVVLNLLGNAAKFTVQGSVTLSAAMAADGERIAIAVEDTGIGIDPARREAIFEAFVQADAGTAGRFGGTGLGLSISARLAGLMGGDLTLNSEPGRGSRFVLTLPFVAASECGQAVRDTAAPAPAIDEPGDAPRRRVLVAEDHDINQILVTAMLNQLGCAVSIAPDGARAAAMVEDAAAAGEPYDLVLMDSQMPVLDGPGAARRIRAAGFGPADLPIVALTANAFADDVAISLSAGMQAHIAKPVTLAELGKALDRWVRSRPVEAPVAAAPTPAPAPAAATGSIRDRYLVRKREALAAVDALMRGGEFTGEPLETALDLLHKLAGTAGMFGEAALGDEARAFEQMLRDNDADARADGAPALAAALHRAA